MVCLPSRGLVSPCLSSSPSLSQLVSDLVSQLVSHLVSQLVLLLVSFVGWCVLDPNTCTPIGCFLHLSSRHLALRQSKRNRKKTWSGLRHLLQTFSRFLSLLFHVFDPAPQNTFWIHPLFGVYGGVIFFGLHGGKSVWPSPQSRWGSLMSATCLASSGMRSIPMLQHRWEPSDKHSCATLKMYKTQITSHWRPDYYYYYFLFFNFHKKRKKHIETDHLIAARETRFLSSQAAPG